MSEPLTPEEEALYREGLRNAPTVTDGVPWSLLQITTAEWADRCRRLLATLDDARSRPAGSAIDVERLAKALILAHSSEDGEPFGDEQESIESLYSRRTSWLDVPEEWYETPRQLAAWVAAQYKRLGEQREGN